MAKLTFLYFSPSSQLASPTPTTPHPSAGSLDSGCSLFTLQEMALSQEAAGTAHLELSQHPAQTLQYISTGCGQLKDRTCGPGSMRPRSPVKTNLAARNNVESWQPPAAASSGPVLRHATPKLLPAQTSDRVPLTQSTGVPTQCGSPLVSNLCSGLPISLTGIFSSTRLSLPMVLPAISPFLGVRPAPHLKNLLPSPALCPL